MSEDKSIDRPKECLHCGSQNMIGPYDYLGPYASIGTLDWIRQNAYICVACGYTMLFTRPNYQKRVIKKAEKIRGYSY